MAKNGSLFYNKAFFRVLTWAAWWSVVIPIALCIDLWAKGVSTTTVPESGHLFLPVLVLWLNWCLSTFLIYPAMWFFLLFRDVSGWGAKIWWSVVFAFTGPIGTFGYFYAEYRRQYIAQFGKSAGASAPAACQ